MQNSAQIDPPQPLAANLRQHWLLKEDVAFLNHGSFGACPIPVLNEQQKWRANIEAQPIEILGRRCEFDLKLERAVLGMHLRMSDRDFGFVTNATEGVNAVLQSLKFKPGDELLTTNHVYNAVRKAMGHVAARSGASYREISIPFPLQSSDQIAGAVIGSLTDKTRLLLIDHVTSPTALIFPVQKISTAARKRGIDVIIDGAHAPGMLPLDVPGQNAPFYAGNLHKWICAPKGSGFLWVNRDRQPEIHPLIISHHYLAGFDKEFGWQGTRDISGLLSIRTAIDFFADFGWDNVMRHNHEMATWAQQMLCHRWDTIPMTPLDGRLIGAMATLRLPLRFQHIDEPAREILQQRLYNEYKVEAPLILWDGHAYVRVSCQIYNRPQDYQRLADAIERITL
ncbi:MAG TPA: aminotransferase class V-fold PLP-dependent enzyme [Tepidisphaeraceae bacterium]|nr:aminotransferase class V-fold PLP-dependent enzyme [Tepidisphaeraceae bacterium]